MSLENFIIEFVTRECNQSISLVYVTIENVTTARHLSISPECMCRKKTRQELNKLRELSTVQLIDQHSLKLINSLWLQ